MHIAVTPGEPAGIGPDLLVTFAQAARAQPLVAYADPALLTERAKRLGVNLHIQELSDHTPSQAARTLTVHPVPLPINVQPGEARAETASAVLESIRLAAQAALKGDTTALVTGPVQKSIINAAGTSFSGHTEMLAELAGVAHVVMLLVSGDLRLALATRHLRLADVPETLTQHGLQQTLQVLNDGLRDTFSLTNPRILVAGLNPHAGEDGHLGREELDIIRPVIDALRDEGMHLKGPFPADTLFTPAVRSRADALVAMYHDQGLAPFKALAFGASVNVTLGLPFIRTSVDHGTALDLAGTGNIDCGSFKAAFELACQLSKNA